jgi:hypothetical protein
MHRFVVSLVLAAALATALCAGLSADGTLLSPSQAAGYMSNAGFLGSGSGNQAYPGNTGYPGNAAYPGGNYPGGTPNMGSGNLMPAGITSRALPAAFNLGGMNNTLAMAHPRSLANHWAVGVDSLPTSAITSPSGAMVAVPSALSVRWWATERLAVDLLVAGNYNSAQAGKGELSPLVSSGPGNAFYAGGLGVRYNISELSHDLLSQFVVKASGAQSAGSISGWSGKATETTLAVFVGAGFEAFVPGWDWLSVEGSAGATGFSQSLTPQGPGNGGVQTISGVGLAGSGFSPINLAAHIYF